jgi:hypothetical protein
MYEIKLFVRAHVSYPVETNEGISNLVGLLEIHIKNLSANYISVRISHFYMKAKIKFIDVKEKFLKIVSYLQE